MSKRKSYDFGKGPTLDELEQLTVDLDEQKPRNKLAEGCTRTLPTTNENADWRVGLYDES